MQSLLAGVQLTVPGGNVGSEQAAAASSAQVAEVFTS
jgi:hypothetical protein